MNSWLRNLVGWVAFTGILACFTETSAQVVKISVPFQKHGVRGESLGSAVCIGTLKSPPTAVFVTAAHNVSDNPYGVWVSLDDKVGWRRTTNVRRHVTEDLATFELPGVRLDGLGVAEDVPENVDVAVCGFGPAIRGRSEQFCFFGSLFDGYIQGERWQHPITGDSGGAVIVQNDKGEQCLAGIVTGYDGTTPMDDRADTAGVKPKTIYVKAETICRFVRTQYGSCPTCPIYVRPEIRQPVIGIGIPIGPPEVVGVARPVPGLRGPADSLSGRGAPPSGQPVISQELVADAVQQYFAANPVRHGRDGRDGKDAPVVSVEALAAVIVRDHADRLRGPAGATGAAGLIGVLDDPDMRAMVRGWLSDPQTRSWLVEQLSQDLRVQDLVRRLEAIEAAARCESTACTGTPLPGAARSTVSQFVLVRSGPSRRVDDMLLRARAQWTDIVEVRKEQIPSNVIVRSFPTLIAFSSAGDVAGMWESEHSVLNTLDLIGRGQYP